MRAQTWVEVLINGVPTKMRVDSCCQKVLLPEEVFETIRHTTTLVPSTVKPFSRLKVGLK